MLQEDPYSTRGPVQLLIGELPSPTPPESYPRLSALKEGPAEFCTTHVVCHEAAKAFLPSTVLISQINPPSLHHVHEEPES